jgi:hypothetical protein
MQLSTDLEKNYVMFKVLFKNPKIQMGDQTFQRLPQI